METLNAPDVLKIEFLFTLVAAISQSARPFLSLSDEVIYAEEAEFG